ncbi:MAG: cytochrome P450 [Actinobacteria bacterium]|nr:cytochrome P450 [Actinomycetota bacterium]
MSYAAFDVMGQFSGVAGDVRDPYPRFHALRRDTPVARNPDGQWEIYTYDLVSQVMRDNVAYPSGVIRELMSVVMGPYPLVGMDEPEHKRLRSLVAQGFRQKTLAHWDADLVVPVVDEMIDGFAARGSAELVSEFTYQYPAMVIAEVLGLPREDHSFFHPRALAVINVSVRPDEGITASAELRDYFADIVEERRADPGTDIISELTQAELDGERLRDEEIFSFLRLLLPAGAETTYRATGSFLFGLLTNPDQMQALRDDRALVGQAIEESIRWEPPLLITSRECARTTRVGDVTIEAGEMVTVNVGSANHDPTRWNHPDDFDLFRPAVPHISFGHGVHMCLGMHLARMEMASAVSRLLDRCPNLRADPERWEADDVHIHGERFRSPTTLPVLFDAA